jgi:uncharacterized protein
VKGIKTIGKLIGIIIICYGIARLGFYFFDDQIVFQSKPLAASYKFKFDQPFEEHSISTEDGSVLNSLLFRTQSLPKGLILYFHGNADNLQRWGKYAIDFTTLGYDVLMMDYRGYGKSSGSPSEDILYDDALLILKWAQTNAPYTKLVIYGRSLGSAIASHLATVAKPDLLILETPFDELSGALYTMSSRYQFSNKDFLKNVKCKTIIVQGTDDWVVPLSSAQRLKPLLKAGDQFVIIEGGGHNNLRDFELYHKTLADALE